MKEVEVVNVEYISHVFPLQSFCFLVIILMLIYRITEDVPQDPLKKAYLFFSSAHSGLIIFWNS